ncbi:MAG: hypothetical protein QOJ42_7953 [Acidobacteriaceae bacterium]|nr:hypothetical protein [Acidobacteriaceae bacterium]
MATEDRAPLILTGVTPHGTTKFVRHTPAHAGQYADAFKGFFSARARAMVAPMRPRTFNLWSCPSAGKCWRV